MTKRYHLLGNGRSAALYNAADEGVVYTCNLPPFAVPKAKATFMVDFKMMHAIHGGSVQVPGDWIVGARPKIYTEKFPDFYLKYSHHIKEMFLDIPEYAGNYTNFNCGHMGAYYILNKLGADNIHLYGFDSLFDPDLSSCTDFYLGSDRSLENNYRLAGNWRPIWTQMFKQFADREFNIYYFKDVPKVEFPENVKIRIISK